MESKNTKIDKIHFRPNPPGNLADTIPFFREGKFHIFYLRNIDKVPWEHIVSEDLVHWNELPTALVSDGPEGGVNGKHMFTGSVIHHEGLYHIYYTGWNDKNPEGREFILHATSLDTVSWSKHRDELIKPDGSIYNDEVQRHFRDPYVFWVEEKKVYRMLFCATLNETGKSVTGVYESSDLENWAPCEPLKIKTRYTSENGNECPDYFSIGEKHYLIISPIFNDGTLYVYADDLEGEYTDPKVSYIDTPFLYAAKRMFDGHRHLISGWIRDNKGEKDGPAEGWGGTMCLMREVYADEEGELCFRPAREVQDYYNTVISQVCEPKSISAGTTINVKTPSDYRMDCIIQMEAGTPVSFRFRCVPGDETSGYNLTINPQESIISLKGPGFDYPRKNCAIDRTKPVKVQAFLNGTLLECFVNDRYAFSSRMYNFTEGDLVISVETCSELLGFTLYQN